MTTRTRRGVPATPPRSEAQPKAAPKPATKVEPKTKPRARERQNYDAAVYLGPRGTETLDKPTASAQKIADREAARRAKK